MNLFSPLDQLIRHFGLGWVVYRPGKSAGVDLAIENSSLFPEPDNDEEVAATILWLKNLWLKNHVDEATQMWERGRINVTERFNGHVHSVEFLNLAQSLLNKKSNQ